MCKNTTPARDGTNFFFSKHIHALTHHHHSPIHARTHAHILNTNVQNAQTETESRFPMSLKTYLIISLFKCPPPAPFLPPLDSPFSCCSWSQVRPCAAAINVPCPTGDYRHQRVSQQPSIAKTDYSINSRKCLPELPKSNKKDAKLKKGAVRCLHVVSPKPAFAACDRSLVLNGHTYTRPHRQLHTSHELHVISVVLDGKLAHAQWPPSRSRVPASAPKRRTCKRPSSKTLKR